MIVKTHFIMEWEYDNEDTFNNNVRKMIMKTNLIKKWGKWKIRRLL